MVSHSLSLLLSVSDLHQLDGWIHLHRLTSSCLPSVLFITTNANANFLWVTVNASSFSPAHTHLSVQKKNKSNRGVSSLWIDCMPACRPAILSFGGMLCHIQNLRIFCPSFLIRYIYTSETRCRLPRLKFLLISFDDITKTKRYSTRVDRIDDTDRLVFALQFALAMFDDITTVTWHSG